LDKLAQKVLVGFGSHDSSPIQSAVSLGKQQQLEVGARGQEKDANQLSIKIFCVFCREEGEKSCWCNKSTKFCM
jgi:hypothetical protein